MGKHMSPKKSLVVYFLMKLGNCLNWKMKQYENKIKRNSESITNIIIIMKEHPNNQYLLCKQQVLLIIRK